MGCTTRRIGFHHGELGMIWHPRPVYPVTIDT